MIGINVNTDALVRYSHKLEEISKNLLPEVVRGTLNDAAFDVKTKTMPSEAGVFTIRQKNFFKANSKFEKASGNDIKTMKSLVGFFSNNLHGKDNYAVKDLQQQEHGGRISARAFIPLKSARVGGSQDKVVRPNARLESIKRIVNSRNAKGKSKSERFVNAVLKAGVGGYVLGDNKAGENILWRVDAMKSNVKNKKFEPRLTPLYDYQKDRGIKINRPTHFMEKASVRSARSMEHFFLLRANRKIKAAFK